MPEPIRIPNRYIIVVGSGLILAAGASLVLALFLSDFSDWRFGQDAETCGLPFVLSDNLYVLNGGEPELLIINAKQDRLCGIVKLDSIPDSVLVAQQVGRIILSDSASRQIWLVDPATKLISNRLQLKIEPSLLAVSPDSESMVVADWGEGIVEFYTLPGGQKTGETKGLAGAHDLRFGADGSLLYVSLADQPEIALINTGSKRLEKIIELPERYGIDHMSRTPDGRLGIAVPPPSEHHRIYLIDLENEEAIAPLELAYPPFRAFSSLYGRYIFLPSSWGGEMPVFSVSKREIIKQLNLRGPVTDIVPGFFGSTIYALSTDARMVWGIDMDTLEIIDEINLPGEPSGMAVHEATGKVYIPIEERSVVAVIDTRISRSNAMRYHEIKLPGKLPTSITTTGSLSFCH